MSWEKTNYRKLIEEAVGHLPSCGEWRLSLISENQEKGTAKVQFRNINEDKAWGTVWFKDGKPSAFQYYQKIGAKK